jgi:protein O-mannosyl-transferase
VNKAKPKSNIRAAGLNKNRNSVFKRNALKRFFRWEMLIILAALICDLNSWGHQFVLDDMRYIVENHIIQSPGNIFRIFVSPLVSVQLGAGHLYRPLTALSLGFNWWIHGPDPDGFHLVNRLIHVMICLGIFWVFRRLLSNTSIASLAALLFAVHPFQTEAVTYIEGRSDVLAMLFFIFAWLFHIQARESGEAKRKYFIAASAFYFFTMISKESGITWIAVTLLTEYVYFSKCSLASLYRSLQQGLWKVFTGYLAAAAIFLSLRAYALGRVLLERTSFVDNPLEHVSFLIRELTALKVLFQSLCLLIWPISLSADYSYNQISLITTWISAAGLVIIGIGLVFIFLFGWSYYRNQNVFFGLSFFLITYSIVSNLIIPIGTIRADRLFYMPSLGIFLALGAGLVEIDGRLQPSWMKKAFRAAIVTLLLLLGVRTVLRNGDWQNAMTLWTKTIQTAPNSTKAHYALGAVYFSQGDNGLAIEQYRKAESIYAQNPELLSNFGNVLSQVGNMEDAIRYFRRALRLAPQNPMIRFRLAGALRATGDLAGAKEQEHAIIAFYDDLIRKDPSNADHHYFKANALFHQDRFEEALSEYRRTLQLDPAYSNAQKSIDLINGKLEAKDRKE